ncbi:hypothetical protein EI94DRAFT_719445 [Lactarius quietus]|nr:hypothetical protein EI94DRAFT_719445 [Lactarius quietus]
MSLAAPDSLPVPPAAHARRRLHRRSSCSSIPRSVSTCSSVWGFDASSEEVEAYMAPLFRGLEGTPDEAAEPVSATHSDDSSSTVKAPRDDDTLSENLSNYHFDIASDENNSAEQANPSATEDSLSQEQSPAPTPAQEDPPVVPKPDRPARLHPLPSQTPPVPGQLRPLVLAEAARQDLPVTGTRPLRIDRSKKQRQEQGGTPQRPPRADAPYARPPARPIHRAATQVNLREAYKRASPHSARAAQARFIPAARPPPWVLFLRFQMSTRWSLLLRYFRLASFPWNMRKINSSMLIVWIDCHL